MLVGHAPHYRPPSSYFTTTSDVPPARSTPCPAWGYIAGYVIAALSILLGATAATRNWVPSFPSLPTFISPTRTAPARGPLARPAERQPIREVDERLYYIKRLAKEDVTYTFARSGGAGGQNVNKVSTKVDMRFNLNAHPWLSEEVKAVLYRTEGGRINANGELQVQSQAERSQLQNIDDALERLQAILDAAAAKARPTVTSQETIVRMKVQKKKADEKRLESKKRLSQKKNSRRESRRGDY